MPPHRSEAACFKPNRSLVLVGMPGSGKSTIGRKLAARLGLSFFDSDHEIETAAGMPIAEIFERHGEPAFREGERKVIARLLSADPIVLSTGGGAYMNAATRDLVREKAVSIWLKADFALLLSRIKRTDKRPLFKHGDPAEILQSLLEKREPYYALSDLHLQVTDAPADETIDRLLAALNDFCGKVPQIG